MKFLILILCLLPTLNWAKDIKKENLLGTEYFSLFDYQAKEKIKSIFAFEDKLIDHALYIETYLQDNPQYRAPGKKYSSHVKLAMNLVYASMMLLNNNNGALEGKLGLEDITSHRQITTNGNLREEVIARYDLAARFLKVAMATAPEDDRIPAWYSANLLRRQLYMEGKVDEAILDFITENTVRAPIFHLFNALTMSSDYDFGEAREKKLLEMVDFMNSKESPCAQLIFRRGEAKKCNTTSKTPFAYQGVTVYMGDAYLKTAVKLHKSDPEASSIYAQKAQALYTRVDWFIFKPKAKKWNMLKHVNQRRDLAQGLMEGEDRTEGYFKTRPYLDIYTCNSCHQDGTSKEALHLRLP
jgi:hypothetical protein